MRWLDLSAYKAKLWVNRFPDGRKRLVISGLVPAGPLWDACVARVGFRPSKNGQALIRDDIYLVAKEMLQIFQRASVREMLPEEVVFKTGQSVRNKTELLDLQEARPLGLNHLGQTVYDGAAGRFVRNENNISAESETADPAMYLRAPNARSLARCADGFVLEMVRGKVMRPADVDAFVKATMSPEGDAGWPRTVQEAIEAAIQRRVAGYASAADPDKLFRFATLLYERQPALTARTSSSVANQQFSTPVPMAVLAQAVLTAGGRTSGLTLEPTIGNGSMVMTLPENMDVYGVEIDPARLSQANSLRDAVIVEGDATVASFERLNPEGTKYRSVIANPPFGGLKAARVMEGLRVSRLDHLIMLRALAAREDDGRGVFVIAADHDSIFPGKEGVLTGGSVSLFNWLSDHYEIESAIEFSGDLYKKQGSSAPVRMVTVGRRRTPEEVAEAFAGKKYRLDRLPVIRSWEEAGEHVRGLIGRLNAAAIQPALQSAEDVLPSTATADAAQPETVAEPGREAAPHSTEFVIPASGRENEEDNELLENMFQTPYAGLAVGDSDSMVPRNLFAPTQIALERLAAELDEPVEDFVLRKMGNPALNRQNLGQFLSPEQIDATALNIRRLEAKEGFLLGDMTGRGKGRVLAALAMYVANEGRGIVFLSDKANLFSDFWRDLQDICGEDTDPRAIFKPVILNAGADIRDQKNNRVIPPTSPAERKALLETTINPLEKNGFNLMFATYSQFNRPADKSDKSAWLPAAADGNLVICDESHNAAGDSNVARNVSAALDHAWGVSFSSATAIKTAAQMVAYRRCFPTGVCNESLPETLAAGGEPLQEIIASMLVEDGAMIRREHDLSRLQFDMFVDQARLERNERLSDQLSSILLQLAAFSGDVQGMCERVNKENQKLLAGLPEESRKGNRLAVSSVNFGSRLYSVLRQFLMAVSVDAVVERSLQHLKEGRKPVIVIEQTMETLLREALADNSVGEEDLEAVSLNNLRIPTISFRDLLNRLLERLCVVTERNDYGNVERRTVFSYAKNKEQAESLAGFIKNMRAEIAKFSDLPLSPIDSIRQRLEKYDFVCGEISGRGLVVNLDEEAGEMTVQNRVDDRLKTIHDFNHGKCDAVILTRAGSTGLSLHASEKFTDQRQRVLLELQIPNNVAERIQFFGRVNRRGQVSEPITETISTGLPAQTRFLAMQNAKLRKLSANTQSNRENAAEMKDVPDILNSVGDKICMNFMLNNPQIATMLDIDLEHEGEADEIYFANKLTGRIALLPITEQKRIYGELFSEYAAFIAEAEMQGVNPFKTREYDLKARVVDRTLYEGAEQATYASVFDKPVYLSTMEWDEVVAPMRATDLHNAIAAARLRLKDDPRVLATTDPDASFDAEPLQEIINEKFNDHRDYLMSTAAIKQKFAGVAEALADKEPNQIKNLEGRRKQMLHLVRQILPGNIIETQIDGEVNRGVVTDVEYPPPGKEHLPGHYQVSIQRPGKERPDKLTLNMMLESGHGAIRVPNLDHTYQDIETVFNAAPSGKLTRTRAILDGNLFKAAQLAASSSIGRAAIYTDENGVRQRAVILNAAITRDMVLATNVRITDPEVALRFARTSDRPRLNTDPVESSPRNMSINNLGDGRFALVCSGLKTHSGKYFLDKDLLKLTGDFVGTRSSMRVEIEQKKLPAVLARLERMGCAFYAAPKYREQIQEIGAAVIAEKQKQQKYDEAKAASASMSMAA